LGRDFVPARVVIGVDPPASARGDACGIVAVALGTDGVARVLADLSVTRPSPERWARAVADASVAHRADRIVAEANQGGAMVESVLRAAEVNLPIRLVHASTGKSARAEPVAALYEELCGLMTGGGYEGPGRSPDRADALVWALSELMLQHRAPPRICDL
jgi:phage terminase large subunit-like protein